MRNKHGIKNLTTSSFSVPVKIPTTTFEVNSPKQSTENRRKIVTDSGYASVTQ